MSADSPISDSYNSVISVLPPEIASQIAAGEVIERPASVVKELVENSLDAGARRVAITLEDGGRQLIQVIDDGEGMGPESARLSLERHATSKIRSADDLFRIGTYGFRGEALPSIASVSEFELISKRSDDHEAYRILVQGGILADQGSTAAPSGTTVRVSQLFGNVPARLKFLKSSQTELQRSLDLVQRLAIARPEVSFTLRHATQENFNHPGGDEISALVAVFGRQIARDLIPVEHDTHCRLTAYLAPPTRTRPNRSQQFLFVNGRPIVNRTLSHAVDQAYHGLIPHGRFPIVVVLIDMPSDLVDVNVHPRKAEVKFVRDHDMHSVVLHSLRDALVTRGLVPRIAPNPTGVIPQPGTPRFHFESSPSAIGGAEVAFQLYTPPSPLDGAKVGSQTYSTASVDGAESDPQQINTANTGGVVAESRHIADQGIDPSAVRILGQITNTYIVVETHEGMAIIDQHTAHERVLYERFRHRASENPTQMLATPIAIELSRREALIVMDRLKEFQDLGFVLEAFGPDTVLLRGTPAGVNAARIEPMLRDVISELVELTVEKKMLAPREAVVISAACKAAVKAGDKMSEPEIRSLLEQLMQCENPYVCPHGRPVIVKLDHTSLEKIFQR